MDSIDGFIFTLIGQFKLSYPEAFASGELSEAVITKAMLDMAEKDPEKFSKVKDDRNITSELAEPVNPTNPPKSELDGGSKDITQEEKIRTEEASQ